MQLHEIVSSKNELYIINFENVSFVFRLLTLGEFERFNKFLNSNVIAPVFLYEEIFNLCTGKKYLNLNLNTPMGPIISTGNLIYNMSGNKEGKDFLLEVAEKRKSIHSESLFEHMRITILSAFTSYTPRDIKSMTEKEFIENFVMAENKLGKTLQGFQRIDLKAIYEEIYSPKKEAPENKEVIHNVEKMEQEIGYWEVQEAESKFIQEEKERLTREHLRKLDARKKS
jgi:hypothetical protein